MGSRWHPEAFNAMMARKLNRNTDRAAYFLQGAIVRSFRGAGEQGTRSGASKASRVKGRENEHGLTPRVQTATMKRSIKWARAGVFVRRIGSTLRGQGGNPSYPLILEYGRRNGKAFRPWARPALKSNQMKLKAMIIA